MTVIERRKKKHYLAVKDNGKRPLFSREGNKKYHPENSSCKQKPNYVRNTSDSIEDDDNMMI